MPAGFRFSRLVPPGTVVFLGLFLLALPGCNGDGSVEIPPPPDPELTASLVCELGTAALTLSNAGGPMSEAGLFELIYADGARDTLYLQLAADESINCRTSNIHGAVALYDETGAAMATADDCLAAALSGLLAETDLGAFIPSPADTGSAGFCTYTIYIDDFHHGPPTFALQPTNFGLRLRFVFDDIGADIRANGDSWACPNFTGDLSIGSIVTETDIVIDEGGDPEVALAGTTTTINDLDVNINGVLGFLADLIIDMFENSFAELIEQGVDEGLSTVAGSDLAAFFVLRPDCGD